MGKFIKVILYILLLTFIFIFFSTIFKSCGDNAVNTVKSGVENVADSAEGLKENAEEALFEDDMGSENGDGDIDYSEPNYDEQPVDYDKGYEEPEAEVAKVKESYNESSNEKPSYSSSSGGRHMIVAGSYLVRSNAESMVDKLSDMGFSNSSIIVFDNSQYNTVIADRFDDYSSAIDASNELKRRGIDAYVHKKKR